MLLSFLMYILCHEEKREKRKKILKLFQIYPSSNTVTTHIPCHEGKGKKKEKILETFLKLPHVIYNHKINISHEEENCEPDVNKSPEGNPSIPLSTIQI